MQRSTLCKLRGAIERANKTKNTSGLGGTSSLKVPTQKMAEQRPERELKKVGGGHGILRESECSFMPTWHLWKMLTEINHLVAKHYLKNRTVCKTGVKHEEYVGKAKVPEVAANLIADKYF